MGYAHALRSFLVSRACSNSWWWWWLWRQARKRHRQLSENGLAALAVVRLGSKAWGAQDPSPAVMEHVCHASNAARCGRYNFFKLGIGVEEDNPTKGVSLCGGLGLCRVSIF